jgi:hypothetical protein
MGAASSSPDYLLQGGRKWKRGERLRWKHEEMAKAELRESLHAKIIIRAMGEIHNNQ